MEKKLRVLVCGATFGKFYMKAILSSEKLILAGILTKGSRNSIDIAKKLNVPLFTSIDDINEKMFDLACVVVRSTIVGGEGSKLVKSLLTKKINVIQEQPVHKNEIAYNYRLAKENGVFYGVNSFYPYFETTFRYLELVKELTKKTRIKSIESTCSIQVLYPFLNILSNIFEGMCIFDLDDNILEFNGYKIVSGKIKEIPFIINIQNQIVPQDPDNYYNWLYKISVVTDSGNLVLTNFDGAIIWEPKIYHERAGMDYVIAENINTKGVGMRIPIMQIIKDNSLENVNSLFCDFYPKCIKNYVDRFYSNIIEKQVNESEMKKQINVCDLWREISNKIGTVEIINPYKINTLIYQKDKGFSSL